MINVIFAMPSDIDIVCCQTTQIQDVRYFYKFRKLVGKEAKIFDANFV